MDKDCFLKEAVITVAERNLFLFTDVSKCVHLSILLWRKITFHHLYIGHWFNSFIIHFLPQFFITPNHIIKRWVELPKGFHDLYFGNYFFSISRIVGANWLTQMMGNFYDPPKVFLDFYGFLFCMLLLQFLLWFVLQVIIFSVFFLVLQVMIFSVLNSVPPSCFPPCYISSTSSVGCVSGGAK